MSFNRAYTDANVLLQTPSIGGTISGQITDSDGIPLETIRAQAMRYDEIEERWLAGNGAWTDSSGHYTITGLITGTYRILFNGVFYWWTGNKGYSSQYYGGGMALETGTDITVTEGQTTANVNVSLPLGGRISGDIIDEGGTTSYYPPHQIHVYSYDSTTETKYYVEHLSILSDTFYQISNLLPGTYLVEASKPSYVPAFHTYEPEISDASVIEVKAGGRIGDANITLSPSAIITGQVSLTDMALAQCIEINAYGEDGTEVEIFEPPTPNSDGTFAFDQGLSPGNYRLEFIDTSGNYESFMSEMITVQEGDTVGTASITLIENIDEPTATLTPTVDIPTTTPVPTNTSIPTAVLTQAPTVTPTAPITASATPVDTPILMPTALPTYTSVPTAIPTATEMPVDTATIAPQPTATDTVAPTSTPTSTLVLIDTPVPMTEVPTSTPMPTSTATATFTPIPPTATTTSTALPTNSATPTATLTAIPTSISIPATVTLTVTPIPTATDVPTESPTGTSVMPTATPIPSTATSIPTETATDVPIETLPEMATEIPTEISTEMPTEVPTATSIPVTATPVIQPTATPFSPVGGINLLIEEGDELNPGANVSVVVRMLDVNVGTTIFTYVVYNFDPPAWVYSNFLFQNSAEGSLVFFDVPAGVSTASIGQGTRQPCTAESTQCALAFKELDAGVQENFIEDGIFVETHIREDVETNDILNIGVSLNDENLNILSSEDTGLNQTEVGVPLTVGVPLSGQGIALEPILVELGVPTSTTSTDESVNRIYFPLISR